jgi:predicted RNase H-like nuclease (RuvC/YqgF family)
MEAYITQDAHWKDIERLDKKIEKNTNDIIEVTKTLVSLETSFEEMRGMPKYLNSLEKSILSLEGEIKRLNDKIETSEKITIKNTSEIERQKERGKIDFVRWVGDNWFKIVSSGLIVWLAVEKFL